MEIPVVAVFSNMFLVRAALIKNQNRKCCNGCHYSSGITMAKLGYQSDHEVVAMALSGKKPGKCCPRQLDSTSDLRQNLPDCCGTDRSMMGLLLCRPHGSSYSTPARIRLQECDLDRVDSRRQSGRCWVHVPVITPCQPVVNRAEFR